MILAVLAKVLQLKKRTTAFVLAVSVQFIIGIIEQHLPGILFPIL